MSPIPFATLALLLIAQPAHASETVPSLASGLGQMALGLGVVIALLLASLWLIKRLSAPRGAASGLKVLGAVSVGTRERVVLVEVADKVLVLGVTGASVNTLHTLDAAELPSHAGAAGPHRAPAGGDFSRWLGQALERRKNAR